jgi:hypothetical protein
MKMVIVYDSVLIPEKERQNPLDSRTGDNSDNKFSFSFSSLYLSLSVSRLCRVGHRVINASGAVGGNRILRGSRSTRRKPTSITMLVCTPQSRYNLTWDLTKAGDMGSQPLTTRAVAQLSSVLNSKKTNYKHALKLRLLRESTE